MRSFNKVMILGNMTADPKPKPTKNGSGMTTFSVATNRDWKDKEGKTVNETHFHKVIAFGRLADTIGQYFKKGAPILLSGRLSNRSYAAKDGKVRYVTEVIAEDFNFVPRGKSRSHEELDAATLESAEAELADELAQKFHFEGEKVEEVVDY